MKTNINRPLPGQEDIAGGKNFGRLLADYKKIKTPLYKTPKFFGSIGIAALVTVLILYNVNIFKTDKTTGCVNPPLKNIAYNRPQFEVSTDKDTIINYKSGTSIKIPANIFVDKKGKPVSGNVKINYREFHDAFDFFMSGIPMTYDSGGVQYVFESAGMMQVNGFQNGAPVFIKDGKTIDISFASQYMGNEYNLYELDTVIGKWILRGKDSVATASYSGDSIPDSDTSLVNPAESITAKLTLIEEEISKIENRKPITPKIAAKGRPQFTLDVSSEEFPEIAVYQNVLFEVGRENKNFSEDSYKQVYENIKLQPYHTGESYRITLTKGKEKFSYIVYPVFEGKNYDEALKEFKIKSELYEKKYAERIAEEKKKKEELEQEMKRYEAGLKYYEEQNAKYLKASQSLSLVYRSFSINSFGYWNCDRPYEAPTVNTVVASFTYGDGKKLELNAVYLTEKNRNLIYTYSGPDYSSFRYDPNSASMIWAVTADYRVAVFSYDDFTAMGNPRGNYTFKMRVSDKNFTSEEEVKIFLKG